MRMGAHRNFAIRAHIGHRTEATEAVMLVSASALNTASTRIRTGDLLITNQM